MKVASSLTMIVIALSSLSARAELNARYTVVPKGMVKATCSAEGQTQESRMNLKISGGKEIWLEAQAKVCTGILGFKEFFLLLPVVLPQQNEAREVMPVPKGRAAALAKMGITQMAVRKTSSGACQNVLEVSYLKSNGSAALHAHVCLKNGRLSMSAPPSRINFNLVDRGIEMAAVFDHMKK
ncbi:MAG: hypothetical protein KF802_04910 [Bdellovibrionaceae bacterium]|nr:hypothetical protein [Pseudobdellovibrionaceae bacterium]MBX3034039.1 hypothetical protein [Pseudobdellovibrionaceae bacterium]